MLNFKTFYPKSNFNQNHNEFVANFLFAHLEEYGDKIEDIYKAIDYAVVNPNLPGGFILQALENEITVGIVLVNSTGMSGYIPENILVYIAVDSKYRGKGYGKQLMQKTIELCQGDLALHVEKDNPARFLYQKVGFTNPYLEMRYKK